MILFFAVDASAGDLATSEATEPPASTTTAAAEPASEARDMSSTRDGATAQSGYLVFIDPATGELAEPTPEQEAALRTRLAAKHQPGIDKSSEGLLPFALDGGGRGFYLQKRFRSASRVEVQEDGSFVFFCGDHPDEPAGHDHGTNNHPDPSIAHDREAILVEPAPES